METLSSHWQTWLATNILAGCADDTLIGTLTQFGVDEALARAEVEAVRQHPYIVAGQNMHMRYKRREALLKTLDRQQRMHPDFMKLERRPLPPFAEFLHDYYYANRPGLFTGAFDHWPARHWTPRLLLEKVGAEPMIQVQLGRERDRHYESNSGQLRREMPFGEFIGRIESGERSNDYYLTANNRAFSNGALKVLHDDMGTIGDGYMTKDMDHGFLWIGPEGIITPLHHDLTNNLFLQVYGRKRFRLIPSMQVPYMGNTDNHVFSDFTFEEPQPQFAQASVFDFVVEPGEALFIPIGWWHHVVGETASISLSFTNFNAPNHFVEYPR